MKRKILIIGKKSFIAQNIYNYLNNIFFIQKISYVEFLKFPLKKIKVFNYIINCSIKRKYLSNKYYSKNDNDFQIANKIINTSVKMIFLSTRKVYKLDHNLTEKSKLQPKCNYSKNKLITEKKLNEILKNRVLILRISNLVGVTDMKKSKRKIHTTFISSFFYYIKKNIIFNNRDIYKDFLTVKKFSDIIKKFIILDVTGLYNVSMGKRVYLNDIVKWLNFHNKKKNKIVFKKLSKKFNKDSFILNNKKLIKKLKIKTQTLELKNYCIYLSKNFFLRKNI